MSRKQAVTETTTSPTTISRKCYILACPNRHLRAAPKEAKPQRPCTAHDASVHEISQSHSDVQEDSFAYCISILVQLCTSICSFRVRFDGQQNAVYLQDFWYRYAPYYVQKPLSTTAYQLQTSWKAERFYDTTILAMQVYVLEHQGDWDIYVQLLKYAYNAQMHREMNLSPFSPDLSHRSSGPTTFNNLTAYQLMHQRQHLYKH